MRDKLRRFAGFEHEVWQVSFGVGVQAFMTFGLHFKLNHSDDCAVNMEIKAHLLKHSDNQVKDNLLNELSRLYRLAKGSKIR